MRAEIERFLKCQSGGTAMEYAFIAALVSTGIIGAISAVGGSLQSFYTSVTSTISGVGGG